MTKLANSRWFWIVFTILTIAVYFSGLMVPLVGPDEPRYAQVAREMFERGDWITPTLGGFNWFEKPALLYWVQIASYHLVEVSEFSARFGSAVLGLATVGCLWLLGRHAITNDDRSSDGFPGLLVAIGASTLAIIVFSHGASFDIIVTFPITAAITAFFIFERKNGTIPLAAFYFFVGVALLAKGLIGIVLPFAIVGFYYLISWRLPSKKFFLSVLWGTILALAVAAIWYVPMYLTHGYEFIDEFFIQHHFQRYTSNKYLHPQPFYFFFWVLPLMTIPWLPFFIAGIIYGARQIIKRQASEAEASLLSLSFAWMLIPAVFFSFSGSKLPGYVLPAVPPAVVFSGVLIAWLIRRNEVWRYPVQIIALGMLLTIYVVISFALPSYADEDSVRSLIAAADLRGFSQSKVMAYQFVSQGAEFYAADRLLREPDGKQKFLNDTTSINTVSSPGQPVLLLVPKDKLAEVEANESFSTEMLGFNGRLYIVAVQAR